MGKIKASDRCKDCTHCRIWSTDRNKATCTLYNEQGFHPDRSVPNKCIDNVTRTF